MALGRYILCALGAGVIFSCSSIDIPDEGTEPDDGGLIVGNTAWEKFVNRGEDNVLLDFSYAGYRHGESEPPDIWDLGYKKYDVTGYGAVPDDGKSDRQAFLDALDAALGGKGWKINGGNYSYNASVPNANAIIYFPAGEFILYDGETDAVDGKSLTIEVRAGNIVLAGAGRDRTSIVMKDPYKPFADNSYAQNLLSFKHWSGFSELSDVVSDASKGSFSVEVSSAAGLSAGKWVALTLGDGANGAYGNNDPEVVAEELYPYALEDRMTQLKNTGVIGAEIHQIASVKGNVVRFKEPLMRDIHKGWGWKLSSYSCYENVGIEDLRFEGHARPDFVHGDLAASSEYGPLLMMRLVNSWVRRVDFHSVTSAAGFTSCANVSAYDIVIDGMRGHTAVNAAKSTGCFFGKIKDISESYGVQGAGQHHASGVSKWATGTVIWNCEWGSQSNFEAHATQPRATLYDCCRGGFIRGHQGGADSELPNHLDDLTIWNFEATSAPSGVWKWWGPESHWRFLPPTIVGFHGVAVDFDVEQVKLNESPGQPVEPLSLYEAQIERRLGSVPQWLGKLR
ncbi:MAG: DUF4955 domain-containing protein [Bacteroidales bacterium]|nr:DUF4955 domain-containing protein [Bacteroidales bacterium]